VVARGNGINVNSNSRDVEDAVPYIFIYSRANRVRPYTKQHKSNIPLRLRVKPAMTRMSNRHIKTPNGINVEKFAVIV